MIVKPNTLNAAQPAAAIANVPPGFVDQADAVPVPDDNVDAPDPVLQEALQWLDTIIPPDAPGGNEANAEAVNVGAAGAPPPYDNRT